MTENIDNLLSRFCPTDQAEQIKKDIAGADKLFGKFPAPDISQKTIEEIKLKINRRQKRISFSAALVKTAAAAVIILAASVFFLMQNGDREKPADNNESSYQAALSQADDNIAALGKEIELLRGEFVAVRLNEDDGTNGRLSDRIGNVETEVIETENSFWKG